MAKKTKVVQFNNRFIQQRRRKAAQTEAENVRKNRFMGWVLLLVILLFTLPTYNLFVSYQNLKKQESKLESLQIEYQNLTSEVDSQTLLMTKLQDSDYAAKYVRARYYYSKDGEFIYSIPSLVPSN